MTKEIYIQLGLPKTGTTTLQNRLYPNHEQYYYLGKYNPDFTPNAKELDNWLLNFKRNLICKDIPYFSELDLNSVLSERFGDKYFDNNKFFLSEESILGRCITPGKYGEHIRVGSAYSIINKLKVLFENNSSFKVKLIVTLRKQDDLLESFFAEEFQNFKMFLSITTADDFVKYLLLDAISEEADSMLRYATFLNYLENQFGKNNVLALPYELLKYRPEFFLNDLSAFMGIEPWNDIDGIKEKKDNNRDVNRKNGKLAKTYPIKKKISHFKNRLIGDYSTGLGDYLNFLDKFKRNTIVSLDHSIKEKIMMNYRSENLKLNGRVNYISDFGYF